MFMFWKWFFIVLAISVVTFPLNYLYNLWEFKREKSEKNIRRESLKISLIMLPMPMFAYLFTCFGLWIGV